MLALLVGASACSTDKPRASAIDPEAPVQVVLATASAEARVTVELAATAKSVARGMTQRRDLGADAGMLFIMPREKNWSFWMKGTLIPLDIIFITRQLTVAGVVHDAVPGTETSNRVGDPSLYVLEVNGGWAKRHGIAKGATVRFENLRY